MSKEVTLVRGAVVGVITAIVHALVVTSVIPTGYEATVSGVVDAVGLVIALLLVRSGVSPADPDKR